MLVEGGGPLGESILSFHHLGPGSRCLMLTGTHEVTMELLVLLSAWPSLLSTGEEHTALGKLQKPSTSWAKYPVPFGSKIVRQAPRFCHRTQQHWQHSHLSFNLELPDISVKCLITYHTVDKNAERNPEYQGENQDGPYDVVCQKLSCEQFQTVNVSTTYLTSRLPNTLEYHGQAVFGGEGTRGIMPASCVHSAKEIQHTMLRRQYFYYLKITTFILEF